MRMISEKIKTTTRPRNGHTQAVHWCQVSNNTFFVASNQRNKDYIIFLALWLKKKYSYTVNPDME